MHPFLAKVTSDELLAELKQREAFGRAAEPWEVANVMVFLASDYSSYLTGEVVSVEQPASLKPRHDGPTPGTAAARAGAASCSRIAAEAVRRARIQEHHRARHRRRRRDPVAAASTTTSTPRSRWSTRSCSTLPGRAVVGRTTRSLPPDSDAAGEARGRSSRSFDAIDQHHRAVAIFQNDAALSRATFDGSRYLHERNGRFRDDVAGAAGAGRRRRRAARRPRHRA